MKSFATHAGTLTERKIKYVLLNQIKDNYLWKDSPMTTKEDTLSRMAAFVNQTDAEIISLQDSLANTFPRLVCKRKDLLDYYHRETGYKFRELLVIEPGFGEKDCLAYSYLGELKALFNLVERTHDPLKPEKLILYDDSVKNMKLLVEYASKASSIQPVPDGRSTNLTCFVDVKGGNIKPENKGELYTIVINKKNKPDDILNHTPSNFLKDYARNLGNHMEKLSSDQAVQENITKINAIKTTDVQAHLEEIFVIVADTHSYLTAKGKLTGAAKEFAGTIILPLSRKNLSIIEKSRLQPEERKLVEFLERYGLKSKAGRDAFNSESLTTKTRPQLELIAEHLENQNRIETGALANFLTEEVTALLKIKK
jgi:hypothetical protein